ncbi:MAG: CoB--CoM heterodisulfide reductase iron-sulfur subunit A family protein, partial [Thermodesulfobacteria bacterium]|nr:CoB--CoM heterodisulfide reductase iron-sulfur subunit A family protein [Thermodesulfobacteriota bacterium]
AGLDTSMLVIANIREQVAWAHPDDPEGAYLRAKDQVLMAIARAKVMEPIAIKDYPVTKKALVLGGGISGMNAAAILAESGVQVSLVEKTGSLGGNARRLLKTWRGKKVSEIIEALEKRLTRNPLVQIFLNSQIENIQGQTGNFISYIKTDKSPGLEPVTHGALIVATGAREAKPRGYLYGKHPGVITHQELDELLLKGKTDEISKAHSIVFIQCVDSCNNERPYCSRVCCTHAVSRAVFLKEKFPQLDIYILYRHMRTYGQRDHFFRKAMKMGVRVKRFSSDEPPRVSMIMELDRDLRPKGSLKVECFDSLTQSDIVLHPDFVVLATAIEPDPKENTRLSRLLKVPLGTDGFFQEMHLKLRPCELRRDGFFVAGLAHYPKEIEESMSQAAAAAAKAMAFISQERVNPDRLTARVLAHRCDGCGLCVDACSEKALSLCQFVFKGKTKYMAEVDDSLCSGCGGCSAVCPKDGIGVPGYMPHEIAAQIETLLRAS